MLVCILLIYTGLLKIFGSVPMVIKSTVFFVVIVCEILQFWQNVVVIACQQFAILHALLKVKNNVYGIICDSLLNVSIITGVYTNVSPAFLYTT